MKTKLIPTSAVWEERKGCFLLIARTKYRKKTRAIAFVYYNEEIAQWAAHTGEFERIGIYVTKKQAQEAAEKLLDVVLPPPPGKKKRRLLNMWSKHGNSN